MGDQEFTIQELKDKVKRAIRCFMRKDSPLIEREAHEQAISHRVAYYLEHLFYKREKLNVDCEYNKHIDACKRSDIELTEFPKKEYENCGCDKCNEWQKDKTLPGKQIRPDVLVHSRGNDGRNLIAMEIKKDKMCPYDKAKLQALTKNEGSYKYQLGVFLYFPKGKPKFRWFVSRPKSPSTSVIKCQAEE